jgi:hypothetical protein
MAMSVIFSENNKDFILEGKYAPTKNFHFLEA